MYVEFGVVIFLTLLCRRQYLVICVSSLIGPLCRVLSVCSIIDVKFH